jgi:hypothetical protein
MRTSVIAWVAGVLVLTLLYVAGTPLWFNTAAPPILGLPPIVFWFVFLPVLSPFVIGLVYLVDRAAGGVGTLERAEPGEPER